MNKILIALVLLTGSANANFFEALKDATVKAIEEQNKLNSGVDGNSPVTSEQAPIPKFNTLAEEAAYKKKQAMMLEQQRNVEEQQYVAKQKDRQERYIAKENAILEKYFIKQTDSLEAIENKFKNRVKLFSEMPKDYKELGEVSEYGKNTYGLFNLTIKAPGETFLSLYGYAGRSQYFSNLEECRDDKYCIQDKFEAYEQYIKDAYESYESRQEEKKRQSDEQAKRLQAENEYKAKMLQLQKDQKNQLANEQKERQKVQSACQTWRAKANKQVHSLGIGDQIVSKAGMIYIIRGVEANTFLIHAGGLPVYVQKSGYIPYSSIKTAPSKYCYQ